MNRDEFWQTIEATKSDDQAEQMAALYGRLMQMHLDEVVRFDEHFRDCMHAARRTDILAAVSIVDGFWISTDAFQDVRSWLVSQGRAVFEATLADPDNLADTLEVGDEFEFEDLCYIAGRVWEERTGRNRDEMYAEGVPPSRSSEVEGPAFANEEEVKIRFPRLAAKFDQQ